MVLTLLIGGVGFINKDPLSLNFHPASGLAILYLFILYLSFFFYTLRCASSNLPEWIVVVIFGKVDGLNTFFQPYRLELVSEEAKGNESK